MLVLTRRPGERLIISDNIKVTILKVRGIQVQIGIDAPPDISIHREEIYQQIQDEKQNNEITSEPCTDDVDQ